MSIAGTAQRVLSIARCVGRRDHTGYVVVLAAAALLLLFSHPLIHGDGLSQFIYLDSVARDGDLDLGNQAQRFGQANTYHMFYHPVSGEVVTAFPFGTAFLLAPGYWLGRALEPLIPASPARADYFTAHQGLPLAYSLAALLATQAYVVAAAWLAYRAACQIAPAPAAALAALACLAGTPLLFYATVEPLDTHALGAFLLALALWLATRGSSPATGGMPPTRALALGLVLGMATLVRWQLLLYAVPVGLALLWCAVRERRALLALSAFALGVGLFVGLCMAYFRRFFGTAFLIPAESQSGQAFVEAPLRYLWRVLFDSARGWLTWSPLAALGIIGMVALVWRGPAAWRVVALAALAGVALELALNASLHDWSGSWAFGQRRMTEAYAPLVLGTAWLLGSAPRRLLYGAVALGATYGLVLFVGYLYYTHTSQHPDGGSVAQVLSWLASEPHSAPLHVIFRERYGPWAWAQPKP